MKTIILLLLTSAVVHAQVQTQNYKPYFVQLKDIKIQRKIGTGFQIVGGLIMGYTIIKGAKNYKDMGYRPDHKRMALQSCGFLMIGTVLKIDSRFRLKALNKRKRQF